MARKRLDLIVSQKDEDVADGYIPIYELFSDPKYCLPTIEKEKWCIGAKQLQEMRKQSFKEVKKRYLLCKGDNFSKFWNGNIDAINDIGMNRFVSLPYFKDLASAMICFQKSDGKTIKVSFGIKYKIYKDYYIAQKDALENGTEPKVTSLYDCKKKRIGNIFKLPTKRVLFDRPDGGKDILKLSCDALLNQFEFWCSAKRISKQEGIRQAMKLIMKLYPVKNLQEIGAYERKCDLDYVEVVVPPNDEGETIVVKSVIPKELSNDMKMIIRRYNKDPENSTQPKLTIANYIWQALVSFNNEKIPLKYSDPQAFEKYLKIKEQEQNIIN